MHNTEGIKQRYGGPLIPVGSDIVGGCVGGGLVGVYASLRNDMNFIIALQEVNKFFRAVLLMFLIYNFF